MLETKANGHDLYDEDHNGEYSQADITKAEGVNIPREIWDKAHEELELISSDKLSADAQMIVAEEWQKLMDSDLRYAIALAEIVNPTKLAVEERLKYLESQESEK